MAIPTAKAFSIARQLNEDLGLRLPAMGSVLGTDASGFPTLSVGSLVSDAQGAFIRIQENEGAQIGTDSLGNAQRVYTPHIIQIVVEQLAGNTGTTVILAKNLMLVLGASMQHGTRVELYETNHATAPSVSGITGTPKQVWDSLRFPLTSTM